MTLAQAINRALLGRPPPTTLKHSSSARMSPQRAASTVSPRAAPRRSAPPGYSTPSSTNRHLRPGARCRHAGILPDPRNPVPRLRPQCRGPDPRRGGDPEFFSNGQYPNPMMVRIAGHGYQKGFGGHFHNDNGLGAFRDIPGIIIASPSRPDDAVAMMHECVGLCSKRGGVVYVNRSRSTGPATSTKKATNMDVALSRPSSGQTSLGEVGSHDEAPTSPS